MLCDKQKESAPGKKGYLWIENRFYNDNIPSISTDTGDETLVWLVLNTHLIVWFWPQNLPQGVDRTMTGTFLLAHVSKSRKWTHI